MPDVDDANGHGEAAWLCTLTTRMRAHYAGTAARVDPADGSGDRLAAELAARVEALRALTGDGAARYRVVGDLDRGGMGHVLLAHDVLLGRTVALKQAVAGTGDGTSDPATAARQQLRLLAEAGTIGRLQHPGIAPVHDVGVDAAGAPFFAMPRLDGRSLADVLASRRGGDPEWPLARVVEILRRVCETMAYAHARGVVHRDLKPANVVVGAYGEVYVLDWGLATETRTGAPVPAAGGGSTAPVDAARPLAGADLTVTGTVLGTPAYMPPERAGATAEGERGDLADVYGVGAMLYEVLAGTPPYARERGDWTVASLLQAIRERPPRPLRELAPAADAELAAVCERAMHRDAAHRYAGMPALAADLRAWSEHRVVGAHGGGPALRLHKWVRRNRALAAAVSAAALALCSTTAWFVVRLATERDVAAAYAQAAEANLREIHDLAVVQRVFDLRRRAERDLWPATVDRVPAMQSWLADADTLRPTRDRLQARRAGPAASGGLPPDGPDAAALAEWRGRLLDDAIAALDAFFAPAPHVPALPLDSTVAAVAARIGAARAIARASVDGEQAAARWHEAARAVRSSVCYGDLELRPQHGLVPLGADPRSGLLEFVHVQSGQSPQRDADGGLQLTAGTGVVLVLLPGGEFAMGASATGDRNVDPFTEPINETPVHTVRLAPFFMAKYELTQAQWQRATGANPSVHSAISEYVRDDAAPLHPVESVDWWQARAVLHKLGLSLPTEAQWEYAARAGTTTPWYRGARIDDLIAPPAGNLADADSAAALGVQGWVPTPGLRDGYVMHAPVGSFPPNAFGLFDMIGNVWEWCDDEYVAYSTPPTPGTGGRPRTANPTTVMYRGGGFDQPAQEARSSNRAGAPPDRRHYSLGLRAVRALE